MLKKLSEKLREKFPATTPGCFMLKVAHLDDAFSEVFWPQASPVEGQSLQQKRKGEKEIPKIRKPKGIKGNLAEIQPKNHQNVQKTHFLQKVPGVNGLIQIRDSG